MALAGSLRSATVTAILAVSDAFLSISTAVFDASVKVLEPMGMDTMVFFDMGQTEVCSRADPKSVSGVGDGMGFTLDKSQLHLIDPETEKVI